jgi:hypothetical protein
MTTQPNNAFFAGRLIQWGLRVKERPALQAEYKELLDRYQDRADFRDLVTNVADGMGLRVLDWGEHGIVFGPSSDSVFAVTGATFRTGRNDVDERLLDGLIQVAIAATVFPTPQELEEDVTVARPPVYVDEVDETLRRMCDELAAAAKNKPDPAIEEAGLYEAWRVYHARLSVQETRDNRAGSRTTRRIIERNLVRLHELGCFVQHKDDESAFHATWRYQVMVKELAATSLYRRVKELLDAEATRSEGGKQQCHA